MDPGTLAGHPPRDVSGDPHGALHSLTRTVAIGARRAAVAALALTLLAGCCIGCAGANGPGAFNPIVTFHPVLLPISITIGLDGNIEVSFDPELVTPIGTFSMSVPLTTFKLTPDETLLAIVFLAAGASGVSARHGGGVPADLTRYGAGDGGDIGAAPVMKQEIIKIKRYAKMQFLVNGPSGLVSSGHTVTLRPGSGVTGIRVKELSPNPGPNPFSVRQVPTLPPAPGLTAPPPTPSVACTPPDRTGTVTCTATTSAGSYTYQWYDNGTPIRSGTSNPLTITLPAGMNLITVTIRDSGYSFSSPPVRVEVKIGTFAASRGPPDASYAIT